MMNKKRILDDIYWHINRASFYVYDRPEDTRSHLANIRKLVKILVEE